MMRFLLASIALVGFATGGAEAPSQPGPPDGPEATSLFDRPLVPPQPSAEARAVLERNLADAKAALDRAPGDAEASIWYGRRLGYLGRYREAIDVYTRALATHSNDARLYRHRGHRYITTRQFGLAIEDFEKAATLTRGRPDEIEPDGQPNARNIPTSTLQANIWYHLGLAYYLTGDFARASAAYAEGVGVSHTADMKVAMTYWRYLALRRAGRLAEATKVLSDVQPGLDIIENGSYYRLLLGFKDGTASAAWLEDTKGLDRATMAYGIGAWLMIQAHPDQALAVWKPLVHTDQWAAFGAIAAEAELKRAGVSLP